ncbi:hypothetical protein [Aureimonas phyllosphaerae]|uniref:Putative membrane protein YkgB n=1 Tax=Aureimonas phyllosphaerae TaxID=1166078 RepID=A0A7W6BPY9_9HYPH|nr:hypothetical protein [Aureimonas phyllosphaerae]MBB3935944.1 putative membrane protein YkgB [Aureimonas phyllosphaerae]MBB3960331.1 putative membrane protein YkgB [Aureimonas phyllosphaerae]SFF36515.1 hypothetical protein SAMN05216566_109130 [Aureimonas phyllosphaerae]
MREGRRTKSQATVLIVVAILVALFLIGLWSDGFGLMGTEMAPGTTTPPGNPT